MFIVHFSKICLQFSSCHVNHVRVANRKLSKLPRCHYCKLQCYAWTVYMSFCCMLQQFGGYRSICGLLQQKHKMIVPHKTVRLLLRQMDPVKVHNHRHHHLLCRTYSSRGPNDTWHTDGYDKPRPHGILISACVTHSWHSEHWAMGLTFCCHMQMTCESYQCSSIWHVLVSEWVVS